MDRNNYVDIIYEKQPVDRSYLQDMARFVILIKLHENISASSEDKVAEVGVNDYRDNRTRQVNIIEFNCEDEQVLKTQRFSGDVECIVHIRRNSLCRLALHLFPTSNITVC